MRLVVCLLALLTVACATGNPTAGSRCFLTPEHQSRLGALLDEARLLPVFAEGQVYGQRFTRIDPGSTLDQQGFQVGDTIVAVNGQPINSTEGSTYLLCVLGGTAPAQLDVERAGAATKLTFTPPSPAPST